MSAREVEVGAESALSVSMTGAALPPGRRELVKRLWVVAIPSYLQTFIGMSVGLWTSSLVGHLGETEELAAVGMGNVFVNLTGYSWIYGLAQAICTLSSQSWGAHSYHAVGLHLQRAFLILLIFADLPLLLLWLNSGPLLRAVGQSHEVARLVSLYTAIRAPGVLCQTLNGVVVKTLFSMSKTTITFGVSVASAICCIVLNFVLIRWLGFVGAPVAALATELLECTAICTFAWRDADFRRCWPGFSRHAWKEWGSFLKLACPSLFLCGIEWWTWDLQTFMAGFISALAQATQAVAPGLAGVQYCAGSALGAGATTVVGNLLGEGSALGAKRCSLLVVQLALALSCLQAWAFVAARATVPHWFTDDPDVYHSIVSILPLTIGFCFFDGLQTVFCGILVATGRQHIAAPLIFVCYWVLGLPIGVCLAFGVLGPRKMGLSGLWVGMLVGVVLHVLAFGTLVCRLNWEKIAEEVRERTQQEREAAEQSAACSAGAATFASEASSDTVSPPFLRSDA